MSWVGEMRDSFPNRSHTLSMFLNGLHGLSMIGLKCNEKVYWEFLHRVRAFKGIDTFIMSAYINVTADLAHRPLFHNVINSIHQPISLCAMARKGVDHHACSSKILNYSTKISAFLMGRFFNYELLVLPRLLLSTIGSSLLNLT